MILYLDSAQPPINSVLDPQGEDRGASGERINIYCSFCDHGITGLNHACAVNGQHTHTFFNPAGVVFEICCFRQAPGCVVRGHSTDEFTWFAGYRWSYALCGRCRAHLGWQYTSAEDSFFGLIAPNLRQDD